MIRAFDSIDLIGLLIAICALIRLAVV